MDWITEQVAVAGGTITPEIWPELRRTMGITAVVNMRAEQQDLFGYPPPAAYLWLPVVDHTDPDLEQLALGAHFVDTLVRAGHRVLIHCGMGIGRSRTMAAAYLIWTGLSVDEALRQVEGTTRPIYRPERRQVLEAFASALPPHRTETSEG